MVEVVTMEKIILIKYGELTTKKANRNLFINKIYDNLKLALEGQVKKIDICMLQQMMFQSIL